ncbi:hypothetical protein J0895_20425 [Phormidium pseudopriestleyi FRX01]|uniref:Uncharacterized protein n=1 Tax=Phormidium pseudopriestleyi FRX01 TaxID=1759528 RepID=A0ABS3FWD2_9CYAN|nr:hypothetical protein [Phormidium pseudopriestleyi]MBO0351400.1 hypothetical protein [Phormidium pseudopriestleyi FRX01]
MGRIDPIQENGTIAVGPRERRETGWGEVLGRCGYGLTTPIDCRGDRTHLRDCS